MKSLRTRADYPEQNLDLLAHFSSQALDKRGVFYEGPLEERGLGPQRVQSSIPHRDPNEHRKIFSQMTGGQASATQHQVDLGTALPETKYNIGHGMGHGEGGQKTQNRRNLASISEGANTMMIPSDKAVSGNPDVIVDSRHYVRPGTHRAEYTVQSYAHKDFPDDPFHETMIDGDLPVPTRSMYEEMEERVAMHTDPKDLDAAAHLVHLSMTDQQSVWGRLGQFAPGSHPLDRRPDGSDDDDNTMT
jgi:hypothetical protein